MGDELEVVSGALRRLASGRAALSEVERQIAAEVEARPGVAPEVAGLLIEARDAGTLTDEQFTVLERVVSRLDEAEDPTRYRQPTAESKETTLRGGGTRFREPVATTRTDSNWDRPQDWTGVYDSPVEVGRLLKGQFKLEKLIGEGGMGKVFLARDLDAEAISHVGQFVAVKVLKPEFRQHPDALKALYEEVRKSRELVHQNIVGVYPCQRDGTTVFMPMEFLEGKPLNVLLNEEFARGMPFERAWPILQGAGHALAYAHDRGIVHSDLKPSNIFVTTSGRAKVLDFGIARAMRTGTRKGYDPGELHALTEAYASPEMHASEAPDPRDDIFSFACVAYEALTGRHPFGNVSTTEAQAQKLKPAPDPNLSRRQYRAFLKALDYSRHSRTARIEDFLAELSHSGVQGPQSRVAIVAAISITVLAAIGLATWYFTRPNEDAALLARLYDPKASTNEADPDIVNSLMEQANGYLEQARQSYDPALLSKSVSSAYGGFAGILRLDPGNRKAAEGVVAVVNEYRRNAHRLADEGDLRKALDAATYGLEINPQSADLRSLREDLSRRAQESR